MAGNWIKVEKVTPDKPEVALLARRLKVSHGDAFLNWFRVYSWADGVTADGRVRFLSASEADTLSGAIPGTCEALASKDIGWLESDESGIIFANWDRHNGRSSKTRALDSERKNKIRFLSVSQPDNHRTNNGLEREGESLSLVPKAQAQGIDAAALKNMDWDGVVSDCREIAQHVKPNKQEDRSLIVKSVVVARLLFDKHWLLSAAKKAKRKPKSSQFAYLHGSLKGKCKDAGCDFNLLLSQVTVPDEILQPKT